MENEEVRIKLKAIRKQMKKWFKKMDKEIHKK